MVPTLDGTMHHFDNVGLYDGLFILQDRESLTIWNHMNGAALYGPGVGTDLGPLGNMFQTTVDQVLTLDASTEIAISHRPYFAAGQRFGPTDIQASGARMLQGYAPSNPGVALPGMFTETLGAEDTRVERMTMGLGIVTDGTVRFYPMEDIEERGAIVDRIDGRTVVLFVDQTTFTPAAVFVETTTARVDGREVRLDAGQVVRRGLLYDGTGALVEAERPQQLFSRWYGFALSFPATEVYAQ